MESLEYSNHLSLPRPVQRAQLSLLSSFCEQACVDVPSGSQNVQELFEGCRTGIGELFETEAGKLALSGLLAQKWQWDEGGKSRLAYIQEKTGGNLAARIEASLQDDWFTKIGTVAAEQKKTRNVVLTNLRNIWRRYGALTAQYNQVENTEVSFVAFATRDTAHRIAKPLPDKPVESQTTPALPEIMIPDDAEPELSPEVAALLSSLEPVEQYILSLLYGLRSVPLSYAQISKRHGIHIEETKRIAADAMAKIHGTDRIALCAALAAAVERRYGLRS